MGKQIEILGEKFKMPVNFGMKFVREFMNYEGITEMAECGNRIAGMQHLRTLQDIDTFYNFIRASINCANPTLLFDQLDKDAVLDDMIGNQEKYQSFFDQYFKTLPVQEPGK